MRGRLGSDGGFNRKLIAPLVSGAVLNPINSTVVAVALVPIGVAFGVLLLGERLSPTAWIGLGCVVIGVAAMTIPPRKPVAATLANAAKTKLAR